MLKFKTETINFSVFIPTLGQRSDDLHNILTLKPINTNSLGPLEILIIDQDESDINITDWQFSYSKKFPKGRIFGYSLLSRGSEIKHKMVK